MFGFGKTKNDPEGIALLKAGRLDDALLHYTNLLQKNPDDQDMILQIARIHFKKRNYSGAKGLLLSVLSKKPHEDHILQILEMTNYKKLSSDKYFNSDPSFSPNGKWVVFTSTRRDTSGDGRIRVEDRPGVYAVHIETREEIHIASDEFYNSHPVFSPDGQSVAYLSAREDTNHDGKIDHTDDRGLYLADISGQTETLLIEPKHRPKFPVFSSDGQSLLFCSWYSQAKVCGIYLLNLRTRKVRTLQGLFESNFPVFSPKGEKIVYTSWRTDTNKDGSIDLRDNSAVYEYNLKTGAENLLIPDTSSNSYPQYSPDGESLLFLSRRRDTNNDGIINSLDNSGIYLLNLSKKREKMLVSDEHYNKFPFFSHDGKNLVFLGSWRSHRRETLGDEPDHSEYFENKGIFFMDLGSSEPNELVSTKYYGCRFPCVSPRESLVCYTSWRKDTNRGLYIAPFGRLPSIEEVKQIIEENL